MDSHFQTAPLLACPSFPNSVAWSEENLVAVASGSIITILNPAVIAGPRGLIKLPNNRPFSIGVVKEEDLFTPSLMPISLSRDTCPCARSISWSPVGFAPNSGCLLAVCSIDGHVKIYRSPYCEYCVEWVEVIDISEMLLDFLVKANFAEKNVFFGNFNQENNDKYYALEAKDNHVIDFPKMGLCNSLKRKRKQRNLMSTTKNDLPLITARQYASRSAMLSSLIVAWSSVLEFNFGNASSCKYAILAVGGKFGKISFWRFQQPECYTIEHGTVPVDAKLVALLQAHNAWITAISWEMLVNNSSEPHLVFATGSSDGSMKLWIANTKDLITSSEDNLTCFQLLNEVITATYIPISTLSMAAPMKSLDKIVLAIGKGSGSLEVWMCHVFLNKFQRIGIYNAHDQVVTGLSWAFDGYCLYSCSQVCIQGLFQEMRDASVSFVHTRETFLSRLGDNSIRSWDLYIDTFDELVLNPPKLRESRNVAQLSDPCLGLALSPGNLMIAVIRSFDIDLLNPMYQARTQKAAVEFFWIGDQPAKNLSMKRPDSKNNILPRGDLSFWKSNILWSLKQYHNMEKPLVLWDILAALLHFTQIAPTFVEHLLFKWLSSWCSDLSSGVSLENILFHVQRSLPKVSIRQIHLLNVICRRLIFPEMKVEVSRDVVIFDEDKLNLWNELLIHSEKEMRVRLVSFSLRAVLFLASHVPEVTASSRRWSPVGVAQMEQWVAINKEIVEDRLPLLVPRIGELGSRIKSVCEKQANESCGFCSASVQFESPEIALCKATKSAGHSVKSHKLGRCAVSMKLCSITNILWFCVCCQRWATCLMPHAFFTRYDPSVDDGYVIESFTFSDRTVPLCPLCGILLQRNGTLDNGDPTDIIEFYGASDS